MSMGEEQRRTPRIARSFMIRYQPKGHAEWLMSPLLDLSSGGARFRSEYAFAAGEAFDIQLVLPNASHPVLLKARTAWAKPWRIGLVEIGATFDPGDLGIQQTIDEAVAHLLRHKEKP
jgi:hypothetical protein